MEARKAMMKIGRRLNEKFNLGLSLQNFEVMIEIEYYFNHLQFQ